MTDVDREAILERAIHHLQRHLDVLRGEKRDLTGVGLWRIACDHLEAAKDVKIITADHYAELVRLARIANSELAATDIIRRLVRAYEKGSEGLLHIVEDARKLLAEAKV